MKRKTLLLGVGFGVAVYLLLFIYSYAISPVITSGSQSKWLEVEVSKQPKFSDTQICKECHYNLYTGMKNHSTVSCEACHGIGSEHVVKRSADTIKVDRSRDFCLNCHLDVGGRGAVTTVSEKHNPGIYCVVCHDPHK